MTTIQQILITFPDNVALNQDVENMLVQLTSMICNQYEKDHENKAVVMWPSGVGSKLTCGLADDRLEFDVSVFHIDVSCREMTEKEKYDRGIKSTYVPPSRDQINRDRYLNQLLHSISMYGGVMKTYGSKQPVFYINTDDESILIDLLKTIPNLTNCDEKKHSLKSVDNAIGMYDGVIIAKVGKKWM